MTVNDGGDDPPFVLRLPERSPGVSSKGRLNLGANPGVKYGRSDCVTRCSESGKFARSLKPGLDKEFFSCGASHQSRIVRRAQESGAISLQCADKM